MIKYLETIVESGLFEEIEKENYIDTLEQLSVTGKRFSKGSAVFYEKDIIDRICIVNRGSVRSEKMYADGEIHILELYEESAIFALEAAASKRRTSPADYICNEDTTIVFIPMASISRCTYKSEITDVLMQKLAGDSIKKTRKIEILGERGLRNRIMIYLDVLRKKEGSSVVTVKMNREQFAQYLCVSRSALSNELNKMKREKIIDFNKERFEIL